MLKRHFLCVVLLCAPTLLAAKHPRTAELCSDPLTAEQTVIYRSFLTSYLADTATSPGSMVNVVMTTEPFDPGTEMHTDDGCLFAHHIEDLWTPQLHKLSSSLIVSDRMRLVDTGTQDTVSSNAASSSMPIGKRKQVNLGTEQVRAAVQPATAMLKLSEIVFDRQHTRAAFHYSYVCGEECGHGETVVYELSAGNWKLVKAGCSKWSI